MNHISPFVNNAMSIISRIIRNGAQQISRWANHSVSLIQLIPQRMQENPHVAIAVVATTNTLFFFALRFIVNRLDQRLENQKKPLTSEERTVKPILLNGVILGGSVFSANLLLSNVTRYPLNKSIVAAITTAAIVIRILSNQVEKYLARNELSDAQEEVEKKVIKVKETKKKDEKSLKRQVKDKNETSKFRNNCIFESSESGSQDTTSEEIILVSENQDNKKPKNEESDRSQQLNKNLQIMLIEPKASPTVPNLKKDKLNLDSITMQPMYPTYLKMDPSLFSDSPLISSVINQSKKKKEEEEKALTLKPHTVKGHNPMLGGTILGPTPLGHLPLKNNKLLVPIIMACAFTIPNFGSKLLSSFQKDKKNKKTINE